MFVETVVTISVVSCLLIVILVRHRRLIKQRKTLRLRQRRRRRVVTEHWHATEPKKIQGFSPFGDSKEPRQYTSSSAAA